MKYWIFTGSELIGPISDEATARELAGSNLFVEINNDADSIEIVPLVKLKNTNKK